MKRDTGSVSRSFPSSISIRIATPVTGFDIDAMRKIASLRIGVFESMSIRPCASKWAIRPRRATSETAPDELFVVDVAAAPLAHPLQALSREADSSGFAAADRGTDAATGRRAPCSTSASMIERQTNMLLHRPLP